MSNSAKRLYAVESTEVVVRNVQHIYIVPYMKFRICNEQIQQAPLRYRIIVNCGWRNILIKMQVIIRRLEGTLENEDRFSAMRYFFRYNRRYICSWYRQYYHHHSKYTYMWTVWLHPWDTRIFYRFVTGNDSMSSLVIHWFSGTLLCINVYVIFWRKLLKNTFILPTLFV